MERMQQHEVQVKESRWMEEIPQRWRQPEGEDRTEMRKEEKRLKCTSLNGSAWSTERKDIRRYRGAFNIFFGIEHKMRKDEMEEQFDKEAKEGWRFAADAARFTDERAGNEDQKHTSGKVLWGAFVGEKRRSSYVNPRKRR